MKSTTDHGSLFNRNLEEASLQKITIQMVNDYCISLRKSKNLSMS